MDRLALIIGNSKYQRVGTLKNPQNDATDIASILSTLGFEVDYYLDLNISKMETAVRDYLPWIIQQFRLILFKPLEPNDLKACTLSPVG